MRWLATALILGLAGRAVAQAGPQLSETTRAYVSVDAATIALKGVKVIDGTGAGPKSHQTIVIANGRIQAVGPTASTSIPAGARVLELSGHTVIPGFAGMHDHTFYTTTGRKSQLSYTAPKLYLASGVTTIRTTGSISPYDEMNLKQQIDRGEVPGPRMHISGPYITGPDASVERRHITTPDEARRVVNYWADEGATWLKVYTTISRENLSAVAGAAHQRGIRVTGHLCSVGYREAVAAGIDGLEHGLMANLEYHPNKQPDQCPTTEHRPLYLKLDLDGPEVQATFRDVNAKGVAITSTLAIHEVMVPNRPPLDPRTIEAMSPEVQKEYLWAREQIAKGEGTVQRRTEAMLRKAMAYEMAFVKSGGLLVAGVDPTNNGGAPPGIGDQRNYELLIEAGFTPVQAVQIMSANGAKVLGVDQDLGTVAPGKIADLVVISGDPAATPSDIKKVVTVFKDGVGYDSAKLFAAVKGLVGIR